MPDLLRRICRARVGGVQAGGLGLLLLAIDDLRLEEITQVVQILFLSILAQLIPSDPLLVNRFTIQFHFPRAASDGVLDYCCSIVVESTLSVTSAGSRHLFLIHDRSGVGIIRTLEFHGLITIEVKRSDWHVQYDGSPFARNLCYNLVAELRHELVHVIRRAVTNLGDCR